MIVANVILDGDEDRHLQFGAGFVADYAPHLFDGAQASAELAAVERENRRIAEEAEAQLRDQAELVAFWAARGNDLVRGPAVVLREFAEGAERADKAQAARERKLAMMGQFGDGAGYKSDVARRREGHALLEKINAEPATVGDVKKLAGQAALSKEKLSLKIDRLFGRRK